ncbi:MAG TPA: lysine-sensitive aspartokinase 3 [Bdellovibrionota bacterium]|nr:lysine-sensitive aspartokinase 3 [Bdellovibrionota bacterium]
MTKNTAKIVCKFGGTSMGSPERIHKCAALSVRSNAAIVVVSATSGTTNKLVEICDSAKLGPETINQLVENVVTKHKTFAQEMGITTNSPWGRELEVVYDELYALAIGIGLLGEISPSARDRILSAGERLSSPLICAALEKIDSRRVVLVDARKLIRTDDNFGSATPDYPSTRSSSGAILSELSGGNLQNCRFVTQGFIGSTSDERTTTLGRGGSDFSASILANAIDADSLEIWTDVTGVASTDPRICSAAKFMDELSYAEAAEMAGFGAKVLHPITLDPVAELQIPVKVLSSLDPDHPGTRICQDPKNMPIVRAINCKRNQSLLTLKTASMLHSHDFLKNIFATFSAHRVGIDSIATSQISVTMTLDDVTLLNEALLRELREYADVSVESGFTLVSVTGNGMAHHPNLAAQMFGAIEGINVRMISAGASDHNICFMVEDKRAAEVVARLHKKFLES